MRTVWIACAPVVSRLALLSAAVAWAVVPSAVAQASQSPTPAQVETFRNLPPDQQQAVLEAMGGTGLGAGAARRDAQLSQPQTLIRQPASEQPLQVIGPPRIAAKSTLLLDVTLQPQPQDPAGVRLAERRARILKGNPYQLDGEGRISLPELSPINLSGLTDEQASQRLTADPRLPGLVFKVMLLPLEPTGTEALKPFGYDLFDEVPTTFAPAHDIPVPSDYRVGPGDNVTIDLFGKKTGRYLLVIDRQGALTLPEFGPMQVTGLTFEQLRVEIERRVGEQTMGVRASVAMAQLRSIRIFVVGDVVSPGSYTVSALATITNALFASGGISRIGSLRDIQLKRGGRTVAHLDLYELLLRGDTSNDQMLQQGDAIFVPPVGSTVSIAGQVRRPAIYELRGSASVAELIELAGGASAEADHRFVTLERIEASRERAVINLDLTDSAQRGHALLAGDIVTVPKVLDDTRGVALEGHVHRPGAYAWRQGMRLTDLLGSLQAFKLNADQRYVLIRREHLPDLRIEAISADAVQAFAARGGEEDPLLQSHDRVLVFGRQPERGPALLSLLDELRVQTRDNSPLPIVTISGRVMAPGDYPLEPEMTVADLIRAGGGLDDAAYPTSAELTRYEVVGSESRKTDVMRIDLTQVSAQAQMRLRAYDTIVIRETPEWREKESVALRGEVRFPGVYPIRQGETLSSVITRAGGLTDAAFVEGGVLMREELRQQERAQVESLANRLQADLALVALQNTQAPGSARSADTLAAGQSLMAQLQATKPVGRLVIDLKRALRQHGGEDDIELRGGDELVVPRFKPYVTVVGEVQNATTHVWKRNVSRDEYIRLSGGTTQRADDRRIYVVRADGSVVAQGGNRWFGGGANVDLNAGDTIVVPIDAERMRPLPLWTAVTTIIYNMAVAVAAIGSL